MQLATIDPTHATHELGARLFELVVAGAAAQEFRPSDGLYLDSDGCRCHVGHLVSADDAHRFDRHQLTVEEAPAVILAAVLEHTREALPPFPEDRQWLVALLGRLQGIHDRANEAGGLDAVWRNRRALIELARDYNFPRPGVLA